jgi:hypothetical protein
MTAQAPHSNRVEENGSGVPLAGAKLYFYDFGTLTERAIYSDPGLSSPLQNPVIANGNGRFPTIFVQPGVYKWRLEDANGTLIAPVVDGEDPGITTDANGRISVSSLPGGNATAFRVIVGAASQADLNSLSSTVAIVQSDVATANASAAAKVPIAGGVTMTGLFNLFGNAVTALQPVPKQQLDAAVSSAVDYKRIQEQIVTPGATELAFDISADNLAQYGTFELELYDLFPTTNADLYFQVSTNTSAWITAGYSATVAAYNASVILRTATTFVGIPLNDTVGAATRVLAAVGGGYGGTIRFNARSANNKSCRAVGDFLDQGSVITRGESSGKMPAAANLVRCRIIASGTTLGGGTGILRGIR